MVTPEPESSSPGAGQRLILWIRRPAVWVTAICVVSFFGLRADCLYRGIEFHPDENQIVGIANLMLKGPLIPVELYYPMGASIVHLPAQAVGEVMAHWEKGRPMEPEELRKRGRLWSLLIAAVTAAMGCWMAFALTGSWFAVLVCGLMFSFGIFSIEHSRYATVDVVAAFFVVLTAALLFLTVRRPEEAHNLVLAAFFAGAAMATKYNMYPFFILPFGVLLWLRRAVTLRLAWCAVAAIAGMILFNPVMIVDSAMFFEFIFAQAVHYGYDPDLGYAGYFVSNAAFSFFFVALFCFGVGLPFFALASPWLIDPEPRRLYAPCLWLSLLSVALFILFVCKQRTFFLRNYYPAVILMTPFAAAGATLAVRKLRAAGRPAVAALIVASLAFTIVRGAAFSFFLSAPDVREVAADFIHRNDALKKERVILVGAYQPAYRETRPAGTWEYTMLEYEIQPGDLVSMNESTYIPYLREPGPGLPMREAYEKMQEVYPAFIDRNEGWKLETFKSPVSNWIFGHPIRGSTLCQYQQSTITLYHRPRD